MYPTLEDLRVSSPITSEPVKPKEPLVKRSASQDLEFSYPHKRIGIGMEAKPESEVCDTSTSKIIKKKKQSSSRPKTAKRTTVCQRSKPIVSNQMDSVSISSPKVSSILSLSNEDEKKELEGLKQSLFAPLINDQNGTSHNPTSKNWSVPKVSPIKKESSLMNTFFNIGPNHSQGHQGWNQLRLQEPLNHAKEANPAHVSEDMDLIQFSDTEVFEVGNLVIGQDIPAINAKGNLSPSNKKSGVDVFKEEQQREEKAHLESSLEEMEQKASIKLFQDLQQQQANAGTAEQHSSKLDEAMQKISILETKVNDLQVDTIDLQHELDIAYVLIRGQARALKDKITKITMNNPSNPSHTPNSAGTLTNNEAPQLPRHIEGQCVHKWPSPNDPTQTVFYHQASWCEWSLRPGMPPTPPNLSNPMGPGTMTLGMISPSPQPRSNGLPMNHGLRREDSMDSLQFNPTRSMIGESTNQSRPSANANITPINPNRHILNPNFSPINQLDAILNPVRSTPLDDRSLASWGSQTHVSETSNNSSFGLSQRHLNIYQSQTSDMVLPSRESSVALCSDNESDQMDPAPAESEDARGGNMPWEPLNDGANDGECYVIKNVSMIMINGWFSYAEPLEREMWLKYVVHSKQGVDPTKGPNVAKNRAPKIFTHTFKARKFSIDINNESFSDLKSTLFEYSDQMGKNAAGNSFIFKVADSTNSVIYLAYIHSHAVYSKGHEAELKSDEDVKNFFRALATHPTRTSGIDVMMVDPNKKKLEAEKSLSIGQHQLLAKNINNNVNTTLSDLAHTTPEDPADKALAELMLKYSTANNNNAEGWRVYKHDDVTKVMPMNFQLLGIWAEEMVKDPAVTVDIPPDLPGFQWSDLKKPVTLQTLLTSNEPVEPVIDGIDDFSPIRPGTISEAQGYDIVVDPYELERIRTHATMEDYMAFAGVRVGKVDEAVQLLLDNNIERFDAFLYPEETGLKDIIDMGIKRGTAMRLMNSARRFYRHLIEDEINNPREPFNSSMCF
ncbi:uncharacterized protein MELLADRAFT_66378 [Melampsora larici-populina 98AG31]|uniref:Uncharacterized protein n=1 Tax=Melampsora larici-populina (strain 98AG31 / pathotype 3-4-7) TaxID=747676 RepID=F4RYY9_MELLP|nr:uncharacterized protein MELLADRAFT_66378 [Melampsora larici-populina 98AG31]EGG02418.1 hypothetical protein MELLADRAFT_66378 [Melampsora larici-populina 98AG31]